MKSFSTWGALCLLSLAQASWAQSWPQYDVVMLQAVKGTGGKAQYTTAAAINQAGVVVGWTAKPVGTKLVPSFSYNVAGFPNLFGPYEWSRVSIFESHPVTWSGAQPKVLARVGTYNTLARDVADDGTILMQVSDTTAKTTDMGGSLQGDTKAHWRLYQSGTYKIPLVSGKRIVATEVYQARGTFLGSAGEIVINGGSSVSTWANGNSQAVLLPASAPGGAAFQSLEQMERWEGGQGWLKGLSWRTDPATAAVLEDSACFIGTSGGFQAVPDVPGTEDFTCLAMNRQGHVFGVAKVKQALTYGSSTSYVMVPQGHYVVQGQKVTPTLTDKVFYGRSYMDEQGRVFAVALNPNQPSGSDDPGHLVVIQNGVVKPVEELTSTSLGKYNMILLSGWNDKGQLLIQVSRGVSGSENLLLTPR